MWEIEVCHYADLFIYLYSLILILTREECEADNLLCGIVTGWGGMRQRGTVCHTHKDHIIVNMPDAQQKTNDRKHSLPLPANHIQCSR